MIEIRKTTSRAASFRRVAGATALAMLLAAGISGCKSGDQAPIITGGNNPNGPDPADANMAPADGTQPTYVAGTSQAYTPQQSSESYPTGQQRPAPIVRGNNAYLNESQNPNAVAPDYTQQQGYADTQQAYDQGYNNGQSEGVMEAEQAPPPLPEYEQPAAPSDNDLWTPGYWGYANTGYYWTPGAWVAAPYIGALWTPGYWGYYGNRYRFHHGYWGRHIGYYGGINYGWGYIGTGYYGGYWNSNRFYYNRAITHVSPRVVTVYERPVVVNNIRYTSITNNRISYNGGRGGIDYQPRPFEVAAMHEQHIAPLPEQRQFHQQAQMNRANFFAENHGRPAQAALTQTVSVRAVTAPPMMNAGVNRGGFGHPGGQPGPGFGQNAPPQAQRMQMEQQHNQQQMQPALAEHQRGLLNQQMQQREQMEQQRNQLQQQRNIQLQQHTNAMEQQRANEAAQRNALAQRNQQIEQQRNLQVEQQRNLQSQQHSEEMRQRSQQMQQRNFGVQQVQPQPRVEQPHNFGAQQQTQPRVEQPHAQAAPQPQHVEQPRMQQAPQPHVEQHAAPAPGGGAEHAGGGGHPGGHY